MKQIYLLLSISLLSSSCDNLNSNNSDKKEIISIMKMQEQAWSNNNLEAFMDGYWKSDSLKFYGASGLTYGWQTTLDNYKKRYPTKNDTGKLKFTVDDISKIDQTAYSVMGRYNLERPIGNVNGVFMIIFKKVNGEWKIIADLSC